MSDLDDSLFMAKNQRPAFFVVPGVWQFATFPTLAAPNYLDFAVAQDMQRAGALHAAFRIDSAFNNQADIVARFVVLIDNDPAFTNVLTNGSLVIARSHDLTPAGLASVGAIVQVAIPPLSDFARIAGDGRRFMALGMEAIVPTADFAAGGISAFFAPKPIATRPIHYPGGW